LCTTKISSDGCFITFILRIKTLKEGKLTDLINVTWLREKTRKRNQLLGDRGQA
jgi:hypothetical protein